MESDHWHRLKKIFNEALSKSPDQREAYLDEVSKEDPRLGKEVWALLEADNKAETFMETPPLPEDLAENGESLVGTRIGQYLLVRIISSGGMGTVYEARQEHPKRLVALKVMKAGVATKSALRRFEYEAEVLAKLRHPHIAQVIEAGTHKEAGGVPYFVMEFI